MIGVDGFEVIVFVTNSCCGNVDVAISNSFIDFTPIIFNPNAEAAMLAFSIALSIAGLINKCLTCFSLLLEIVKSTLLILLSPEVIAVSIQFDVALILKLSITMEFLTINPIRSPIPDCE